MAMGASPYAMHRTILVVDVEKFGDRSRTNSHQISADFRTGISALGSGEFEAELASAPPGDGGAGGEVGVAEDG